MIGFRRNGRTIVISCETTRSNHKRVRIFNDYIQTVRCSNSDVKFKFFPNRYQLIRSPFTTLLTNNFTQFLPTLDNDRVRSITSNVRRVILLVLEKISKKKKINIQQERINNKYTRVYVYICEMPLVVLLYRHRREIQPRQGTRRRFIPLAKRDLVVLISQRCHPLPPPSPATPSHGQLWEKNKQRDKDAFSLFTIIIM